MHHFLGLGKGFFILRMNYRQRRAFFDIIADRREIRKADGKIGSLRHGRTSAAQSDERVADLPCVDGADITAFFRRYGTNHRRFRQMLSQWQL